MIPMAEPITASEAARRFSDLLERTHHRGESFIILQGGREAGRLVPPSEPKRGTVADFLALLERRGLPDDRFAADLEDIQHAQPPLPEDPWGS